MASLLTSGPLNAEALKAGVAIINHVDMDIVVHELIDSSNSWSLQQIKAGKALPFACFAEQQTQGRGRRGKHWVMTANSNIAMSLVWLFSLSYQQLQLLPLSIAMAIAETLECHKLKNVQIKWPNDIYVKGKKIAGVLIETKYVDVSQVAVVIGIGVNFDMDDDMLSLLRSDSQNLLAVTDICGECESQGFEKKPDRQLMAITLLQNVITVCQQFQQQSKNYLEKFRTQYDYCKGKNVEVILDNNEVLSGIAQGVNDNAELLVLIDGEQRVFNSADVSVKADANI